MTTAGGRVEFIKNEVVLPDGRTVGEALAGGHDGWVEEELLGPVFALGADGLPRFKLLYHELARGQWKTGSLGAIALAEAVLAPGTDVVIAAGDVEQASIVLDQIDGYLIRNQRLASLFRARGNERLADGGSRVRVISSDAPTAWGLGGTHRRFRVLADELAVWRDEQLWEALSSATGKVEDAQTIVASNAGFDPEHAWAWRVREAARVSEWGHLYAPAGIIASWITPEWVERMRALLPPAAFQRVVQNTWTSGAGDFVTAEQWRRCVDERLAPQPRGRVSRHWAGLDLGLTKDRTALAVVHRDEESVVLDELSVWEGTAREPVSITMIEHAVVDAARRFPGLQVAADPWQLKGSIERLRAGRVRIAEFVFSTGSVQKLSTALYHAITSAALRVFPDAELEREILGLTVVESAAGWRFDHRAGSYSDRAVALAMALQAAQRSGGSGFSISVPRARIPIFSDADGRLFVTRGLS